MNAAKTENQHADEPSDIAIFTGGCFWHMEASFRQLDGVSNVYAGYTGGTKKNPTYNQVIAGTTDHLESVEVHYNPNAISYGELLRNFWRNVDPADAGEQSAIFYTSSEQKASAEASRKELAASERLDVVTKIAAASTFYKAEDEHQNVYGGPRNER